MSSSGGGGGGEEEVGEEGSGREGTDGAQKRNTIALLCADGFMIMKVEPVGRAGQSRTQRSFSTSPVLCVRLPAAEAASACDSTIILQRALIALVLQLERGGVCLLLLRPFVSFMLLFFLVFNYSLWQTDLSCFSC